MHVRQMFPKEYLSAADIAGRGDVTLTISDIKQEELQSEGGKEHKWCVHFREFEDAHRRNARIVNKRLVLNKTNAKTIAKMHGNETDEWAGKRVTLFATTCEAFGETVDCIRVRSAPVREAVDPLAQSEDDDPLAGIADHDPETGEVLDDPLGGVVSQ